MKKIYVLILFILTFFQSFAWKINELKDDFNEPTGEISISQWDISKKGRISIGKKPSNGEPYIFIYNENINVSSLVKIKIDKNNPMSFNGMVIDETCVVIDLKDNLFKEMKNGKTMKIVITNYREKVLLQFDLGNFEESYKMVK